MKEEIHALEENKTWRQQGASIGRCHKGFIHALEENKTWELVPLPQGKKAIGYRWICKIKYKAMET